MASGVPTLTDVARRAGVSSKTVSRVVNNEPGVRADTVERVRAAAHALGYTANLAARRLAGGRTGSIGMLIYASSNWQWTAELVSGALARSRERGYGLVPYILESYTRDERETVLWLAAQHAVDGVILTVPWNENQQLHTELAARRMPFVLLPAPAGADGLSVSSDDRRSARIATDHLIQLGHSRIAVLGGQLELDLTRQRLKGFGDAMRAAGHDPAGAMRSLQDYTFATGLTGARRLLALDPRPTAIFAFGDVLAAGALHAAHELGLRVPEELSVIGMGDIAIAQMVWPPLTTMATPTESMAATAVDLLIDELTGRVGEPRAASFEGRLVVRSSTGPAPPRGV